MKNSQQPQTQPRPIQRRRVTWDSRRRQEDDMDDRPLLPTRSSAIVNMVQDEEMVPLTDLYPTLSNLHRHGVAVGQPVSSTTSNSRSDELNGNREHHQQHHLENHHQRQQQDRIGLCQLQSQQIYNQLPKRTRRRGPVASIPAANTVTANSIPSNRRPRQRPQTVDVPRRGVRQHLSEVTMASDLASFDGSVSFEAIIPPADDYLDDHQLQEYLGRLAKEEDRKSRERELLKEQMFASSVAGKEEREALSQLLQQMEFGGPGSNEDYEEYLNRLMEEQLQAEEQCKIESIQKSIRHARLSNCVL